MKKYLFIVLLVGVGFGQDNPCEDPKYLEIKVKSYNEVSESEYQYFLKIRKECKSFRDKERKQEKKRKAQSTKRKFANESQWIDEQSKIIKNKKDYPNNDLWKSNKSNDNPCEDTKYMSLRNRALKEELKKPLTHMTDNEFRLFMLKDDECSEYKRKQKKVYEDSVKKAEKNSQKSKYTSKRKREKPKSKNNQSSKFWLDVGMEVLNILNEHQGNSRNNFNVGGNSSSQSCQYDDSKLKWTVETKVDTDSMRKFRKYKCTNIANTHYYWVPE